jgi:hypothetical protein
LLSCLFQFLGYLAHDPFLHLLMDLFGKISRPNLLFLSFIIFNNLEESHHFSMDTSLCGSLQQEKLFSFNGPSGFCR